MLAVGPQLIPIRVPRRVVVATGVVVVVVVVIGVGVTVVVVVVMVVLRLLIVLSFCRSEGRQRGLINWCLRIDLRWVLSRPRRPPH